MKQRVAVVGHVEWVRFATVDRPPEPGAVLRAPGSRLEPAGGGAAAAAELARLAGHCLLVTATGSDALGDAVAPALGRSEITVTGPRRPEGHRQAVTMIDPRGERTIMVIGPAQSACGHEVDPALFDDIDALYFCKGDAALLRLARRARVLVATARVLDVVRESGVQLDALVRSGHDPDESYEEGDLAPRPRLVATTDGAKGGAWDSAGASGRWTPTPPLAPIVDAYGAGDCFAAGLAWALAQGLGPQEAVDFAATRGAAALTRHGAGTAVAEAVAGWDRWVGPGDEV